MEKFKQPIQNECNIFHIVQLDKYRFLFIISKLNVGTAKYQLIQLTLFTFSSQINLKVYVRPKPAN